MVTNEGISINWNPYKEASLSRSFFVVSDTTVNARSGVSINSPNFPLFEKLQLSFLYTISFFSKL